MNNSIITKFSLWFSKKIRITFLIFLVITILGTLSYTTFLKREGFPSINIPVGIINIQYVADDANQVNEEITVPVENVLSEIDEITTVQSVTYGRGANIVLNFSTDVTSAEGIEIVKNELFRNYNFPNGAEVDFNALDASKIAEEYDMYFTVTSQQKSLLELQEVATEIQEELSQDKSISRVEVIESIEESLNVQTGNTEQIQVTFNRVGREINNEIVFTDAIGVGVVKKDQEMGAIEFSNIVNDLLDDYREQEDVEIIISLGDPAISVQQQIQSLEMNAIQALLVVLVVVLFLVNWRASLISVLFIPTVFAATFLGMYLIGYSLNVMTLFALILVLGLIVDDAIVVVEAIDYEKRNGAKGLEAVRSAINKIGIADVSGTITTLIVFMPMALMTGILGDFVVFIPITVIISLLTSIFIGLSIIPFLSNLIIVDKKKEKEKQGIKKVLDIILNGPTRFVNRLGESLSNIIKSYLSKKLLVVGIIILSVILIAAGGSFAGLLEQNNFPSPKDSNEISLSVNFDRDLTLEESEEIVYEIERGIKLYDEYVETVEYFRFWDSQQKSIVMYVDLTDMNNRDTTSVEIAEDMTSDFSVLENVNVRIEPIGAGGGQEEYPFKLRVFGEDDEQRIEIANTVLEYIQGLEVSEEIRVADARLSYTQTLAKVDGRRYVEVEAKLNDSTTQSLEALKENVTNEFSAERLNELGWDEDSIGFSLGIEEEFNESIQSAGYAMIVAVVVMYAFLVLQFNSFVEPLLIFMAIPFSFPGVFPGLYLTNNQFSFFVIIGALGLMGIAVNNTIMLLDYAKQRREDGESIIDSIVNAIKIRFRPLLTTSITTITGLIPLAISDPFWESIAVTIIFGLLSSMLMVIFVFPAFYVVAEYLREKVFHKYLPFLK